MRHTKAEDMTIYGGLAYGREVKSAFPENVLAVIGANEYATPELLERARDLFPQADMSDYDVTQTGPDKFLFTDRATGEQYRRVEYDPLIQPDPRSTDVVAFVVDHGGRLHYLRRRGPQRPSESRVLVMSVVERRLS